MSNADLVLLFQVISLVGAAGLAGKLFVTGLWKHYPIFFVYFLFRIPNSIWPLVIKSTSALLYLHIWMFTEPLTWIFHIAVVFELYRLVLQDQKGIYTMGKWAMWVSLVIAVTISILSLIPHFTVRTPDVTKRMGYEFATARGIDFSLALFLILILFFLSVYAFNLSRNVVLHAALYTILFFSEALMVFLRTFGILNKDSINIVALGLSCACITTWIVMLNSHGEKVAAVAAVSPQREENALRQLQVINDFLKVSRK